jgi:hypothetical protein
VGAIRHQGFIPHDDDVDIECFETDLEHIAALPLDPPLYMGFSKGSSLWRGTPWQDFYFSMENWALICSHDRQISLKGI